MAALCVNTGTDNMLLIVLFLSGAVCSKVSLSINAARNLEGLSGSCLQIPCHFNPSTDVEDKFNNTRPVSAVWMKEDPRFSIFPKNVIFNTSRPNADNRYPMKIVGNLSEKNCDTIFYNLTIDYTNKYFFRIENRPFMATASDDPVHITVIDSPPAPKINISGELTENKLLTITCSAATPCPQSPPALTWNTPLGNNLDKIENKDRSFTTTKQVNITLSEEHDGLNITCSASYPVNTGTESRTAEHTVTLNVSYSPKDTKVTVSPGAAGPLSLGTWVNMTCSSRAKPPVSRFTWFKRNGTGTFNLSDGDFYSFNVTSLDSGGIYYCLATNDVGNQTSQQIPLTIEGPETPEDPQNLYTILGVITGIILLLCLVGFALWLKSMNKTAQAQNQVGEEPVSQAEGEEEVHYGEIDFSKLQPKASADGAQAQGEQQDTEYAEVKVALQANTPTQTDKVPEDIYAQVKKRH